MERTCLTGSVATSSPWLDVEVAGSSGSDSEATIVSRWSLLRPVRLLGLVTAASAAGALALHLSRHSSGLLATAPTRGLESEDKFTLVDHAGLAPLENKHDGNVCEDDEELLNGLCYKTCKELTKDLYPIRTTAWSCCANKPCLFNQQFVPKICSGFDVAGDAAGGGCPHAPGACLEDEELSLGLCYKKCSLLAGNDFPYRIAAATCCKLRGVGCLNLLHTKTSKAFDVGGGKGDGDETTPATPHLPMQELTESKS